MSGDDEGNSKFVPGGRRGPMKLRLPKWKDLKVGDGIVIYQDQLPDNEFFVEPVAKSSQHKTEHRYVVKAIRRQSGGVVAEYGRSLEGPTTGYVSLSEPGTDVSPQ